MWYISIFDAKHNTSMREINRAREEWTVKGKDKLMLEKCQTYQRFEVLGQFPLKVIFIIETDDPNVLNILSHHFGDGWNSVSYPVIQREICEALEEDHTIIGG